jgi:hypothetical protein
MRIKHTREYSLFKTQTGNRPISERRVLELADAIKKKNLLHLNPIIVNYNYEVIDGQHRLQAAMAANVAIYYVQHDLCLEDTKNLNVSQCAWKASDFIQSYAELGNENYQYLMELKERFGLPYSNIGIVLSGEDGCSLREGNLTQFFEKKETEKILSDIKKMAELYPFMQKRSHIRAIVKMHRMGVSTSYVYEKAACYKNIFRQFSKMDDILREFELALNYYAKTNKIYLR